MSHFFHSETPLGRLMSTDVLLEEPIGLLGRSRVSVWERETPEQLVLVAFLELSDS